MRHLINLIKSLFLRLFTHGSEIIIRLQVYPGGIRHICSDKRVNEWKAPGKKTIVKCAVNQRQVVIALSGGELAYFEMDPVRSFFIIILFLNA